MHKTMSMTFCTQHWKISDWEQAYHLQNIAKTLCRIFWNMMGLVSIIDFHYLWLNLKFFISFVTESPTTEDSVQNLQRLAFKHKMKVVKDAACRKPMPKVIKVSDVYPSATKIYLPQCTIIHQCAEDTGCCSGPFEKCGPKSSEKVDLYFYAYVSVTFSSLYLSSMNVVLLEIDSGRIEKRKRYFLL